MAFYPTEDYQVLTATTRAEMEAKTRQAIADGYELVGEVLFDSKYEPNNYPFTQGVVKRTNTDPQYIKDLVTAFTPLFNGITSQLSSINAHLAQIEQNTDKTA